MTDLSGLETTPEVGDEGLGRRAPPRCIADFVDVLHSRRGDMAIGARPSAFNASLRFGSSRSAARTRCRRW